ncbi:MAG: hypothetical protein ACK5BE_07010 [Alphaproteobacteria bacterium]|jgi:hypothetical protein
MNNENIDPIFELINLLDNLKTSNPLTFKKHAENFCLELIEVLRFVIQDIETLKNELEAKK